MVLIYNNLHKMFLLFKYFAQYNNAHNFKVLMTFLQISSFSRQF